MTHDEIRAAVVECLAGAVPELDEKSLKASVAFRDQLDMDSIDVLNFVVALDERLGVAVPESDYPRIATLDSCIAYFEAALPGVTQES